MVAGASADDEDAFVRYARDNLFIRMKSGAIRPLALNQVQRALHRTIEDQRHRTGKVRALVLKARQPGVSTYVEARFYWQVLQSPGVRAFILTHLRDSTDAIFEMVERFHARNPDPAKPRLAAANAHELLFAATDSGYRVGTAGGRAVGRGQTVQLFHGSEVAHWPNAAGHMAGVMQAVPEAPETEIILESTANGPAGLFYDLCKAAERGDGDYALVFIPWFDHAEYAAPPPPGWAAPPAFAEYGALHRLAPDQLYWACRKNQALARACGADPAEPCWLFRQEYPATAEEAFRGADHDGLIRAELVIRARRHVAPDQRHAPLVLGVDIARGGGDRSHIIDRRGRRAGGQVNRSIDSPDLMQVSGAVARVFERLDPAMTFVDGTGIGAGVFDRLREQGYRRLRLVNFGARAEDPRRYANRRAEMWDRLKDWLADEVGVSIPDDDALQAQLCAPGYGFDSNDRLLLEPKEKSRARLGASPDAADALALTFAESVRREAGIPPLAARASSDYSVFGE
jgi:hypothetical protein